MKLDNETLRIWALAMNKFKTAKLYFAYIQTNKTSEAYTKSFFEGMGVNPERIVFLRRLSTNEYLQLLAQMDIILGSSPEQGGVTCYDALMCNVPYIVYAANSSILSSSYILNKLGLSKWIAYSSTEFIGRIREELLNMKRRKLINLRADCLEASKEIENQYLKKIFGGIDYIMKDVHKHETTLKV